MRRHKRLLILLFILAATGACLAWYMGQHRARRIATGLSLIDQNIHSAGGRVWFSAPLRRPVEITWVSNHEILLFRPTDGLPDTRSSYPPKTSQWSVERIDTRSGARKPAPFAAKPSAMARYFTASPDGQRLVWLDLDRSTKRSMGRTSVSTIDGAHVHQLEAMMPPMADHYQWMPDSRHLVVPNLGIDRDSPVASVDTEDNGGTSIPVEDSSLDWTDLLAAGKDEIYDLSTDMSNSNSNPRSFRTAPHTVILSAYSTHTGKRMRRTRFPMRSMRTALPFFQSWSLAPDGKLFAVVVNRDDTGILSRLLRLLHIKRQPRNVQALMIYGPGPKNVREVYSLVPGVQSSSTASAQVKAMAEAPIYITNVCWSPDGKQIAFTANGSLYVAPTQ